MGDTLSPLMRAASYVLLLLLPALASAMDVQGTLSADTVWKKSQSPYVLTGDVTVPWGAKLTVEAGVQVIAVPEDALHSGLDPQHVELVVDGTLLVRGTSSQPVEFTSHGRPGSWYGIRIRGGRGTLIDGAVIDQATQGISLGMSATVRNTSVSALAGSCIQVTWGASALLNNDTTGCGGRERASPVRPLAPGEPPPQVSPPQATSPQVAAPADLPANPQAHAPPAPRTPAPSSRLPESPPAESRVERSQPRASSVPAAPRSPSPQSPQSPPADGSECAIEPQVREPPECPGIRRWRKNQERVGEVPPRSTRQRPSGLNVTAAAGQ